MNPELSEQDLEKQIKENREMLSSVHKLKPAGQGLLPVALSIQSNSTHIYWVLTHKALWATQRELQWLRAGQCKELTYRRQESEGRAPNTSVHLAFAPCVQAAPLPSPWHYTSGTSAIFGHCKAKRREFTAWSLIRSPPASFQKGLKGASAVNF